MSMRTIYLDSDFAVHLEQQEGFLPFETDFFDGMCDTLVEGYRIVPDGKTWTRQDGKVFAGEMIAPLQWTDVLEAAQGEYEKAQEQIAELEAYYNAMQEVIE